MPFTLHFDSQENKEIFDLSILAELAKCSANGKFNKLTFDNNFNQPVARLPESIKYVQFGYSFKQDISDIGDHIETIEFQTEDFNYDLATFPKGLRALKIAGDKISSTIGNLPHGLQSLTIQVSNFNDMLDLVSSNLESLKISSNSFNHPLDRLPASLRNLDIIAIRFNQPISSLPFGLESLKIDARIFNQKLDNLPPGLKKLILKDCDLFIEPLDNLPQGLEMLDLHLGYQVTFGLEYKHTLAHLPAGIRKMRLANYWGDLNEIPDSVEELDIWFPPTLSKQVRTRIQHWRRIPTGLKILDLHRDMARINKIHDMTDILLTNIDCHGVCINGRIID